MSAWDESPKVEVPHRKRNVAVWLLVIVFAVGVSVAFRIFERMSAG